MRLPEQEAKRFIALYSAMIGWCYARLDPKGKVRDVQAFLEVEMADKAEGRDIVLDNADRAREPDAPILDTPSYRDTWRRW